MRKLLLATSIILSSTGAFSQATQYPCIGYNYERGGEVNLPAVFVVDIDSIYIFQELPILDRRFFGVKYGFKIKKIHEYSSQTVYELYNNQQSENELYGVPLGISDFITIEHDWIEVQVSWTFEGSRKTIKTKFRRKLL